MSRPREPDGPGEPRAWLPDPGTYARRGWDREREIRWRENHGRYTPFGGETVPSSPDAPGGTWTPSLHLADPSPGPRDDGRHAIRPGKEETRSDEQSGWNVLVEDVEIR